MNFGGYSQNQFLGSGSFSNVYKVTLNNKQYALKKIHPYLLKDPSNRNAILKQISIMKDLDHPNIIKFYDLLQTNQNQLNLMLEYAENGNLYNQLKIHQKLSQPQTINYLKDIVSAIKYLHQRKYPILHRDIKPENILLTKDNSCKLADFGSSNTLEQQRYTFVGTKEYMAPEIINNQSYGREIDLWCLGVLIYQMLTGNLPKYQNGNITLPPSVSRPAQDVIKKLLQVEPSVRMTLQELQDHIWFAGSSLLSNGSKLLTIANQSSHAVQRLKKLTELKQKASVNDQCKQKQGQLKNLQLIEKEKEKIVESKIGESVNKNLQLVQFLSELKINLDKQKKLIMTGLNDYQNTRMQKLTQVYRLSQKITQYDNNINTLIKKYPMKFNYQLEGIIKGFMKKVDNLQQYVQYIPTKLSQQVLDMPQVNFVREKKLVIDKELIRLRTYMLNCQKDFLVELISAKRKQKSFMLLGE